MAISQSESEIGCVLLIHRVLSSNIISRRYKWIADLFFTSKVTSLYLPEPLPILLRELSLMGKFANNSFPCFVWKTGSVNWERIDDP